MSALTVAPSFTLWDETTQSNISVPFKAMQPQIGDKPAIYIQDNDTILPELRMIVTIRVYTNQDGTIHVKGKTSVPFLGIDGVTIHESTRKEEFTIPAAATVDHHKLMLTIWHTTVDHTDFYDGIENGRPVW